MPRTDVLYQWDARVRTLFPELKPCQASTLALFSLGMALARTCGLTTVAAYLAAFLGRQENTVRQRLRELYQPAAVQCGARRTELDLTVCFGGLVRGAASGATDRRLVLALDPTTLKDRFTVLCAGVMYRGCGLPVAWAVRPAAKTGSWNAVWVDLLGRLRRDLGDGWTVLVLTDRGLESAELFRAITALGWHPLMRAKAAGTFQPAGWHKGYPMRRFAPAAGRRWAGAGVAYTRESRLSCALLACWEPGHAEPWLVLTDLPAAAADPAWYAWRMGIEQGFKVLKSGQWGWDPTRITEAARAERQWAALAVATVWLVEVGGEGEPADLPPVPRGRARRLLKRGLLAVWAALIRGLDLPRGRFHPTAAWPDRGWEPDPLTEAEMESAHSMQKT
jgi:Transposase DDE domain